MQKSSMRDIVSQGLMIFGLFLFFDLLAIFDLLNVKPFIAFLLVLIPVGGLLLRGLMIGFPLLTALFIAPFLLSFIVILFVKHNPNFQINQDWDWLKSTPWWVIYASLLAIASLIASFTKPKTQPEYRELQRLVAFFGFTIRYALWGTLLSLGFAGISNFLVNLTNIEFLPKFNFADLGFNTLPAAHWFWQINTAMLLILFLQDMFWKKSTRENEWDVFISYKSKNVHVARAIADRLIASGLRVWFAEYQVLLQDRDEFQKAIDRGIERSQYGIALTNNDYANSEYCELEMKQLLEHLGAEKIFEIMIPRDPKPHQKFTQLKQANQFIYQGELEAIFDALRGLTGWKITSTEKEKSVPPEYFKKEFMGIDYKINVGGWDQQTTSFHGGGPCYSKIAEGHEIFWNLQYGEDISPEVYESRFSLKEESDRDLYNYLIAYADHYFSDLKRSYQILGVHLFFFAGMSQFLITYTNGKLYKRRYSIILLHEKRGTAVEFLFTFEFVGSFQDYCRLSYVMDDLVESFRWGKTTADFSEIDSSHHKPSAKSERTSRLIKDQPQAHKAYTDGLQAAKTGKIDRAIEIWKKGLDYTMLPEVRGAILYNLGLAFEKQGKFEQAVSYYKESASSNPAQYNALCNIGAIYNRLRKHKKALDYLLKAEEINPKDKVTLQNLAICYQGLGENEKSAKVLEQLEKIKK